jgi:Tol biopolymer transport system component
MSWPRRPGLVSLPVLAVIGSLFWMAGPQVAHAALPGTNGLIAFQSDRTGVMRIYTMETDGADQTKLKSVQEKDYDAAWFPDGTGLAFSTCCASGTSRLEVYGINANATGTTRLTDNTSRDAQPAWSPDGTRIAFAASRDGNKEIYIMNADGSGQTDLTNNPATDTSPSWSPDGTQIAFTSNRSGNSNVFIMNADGTGVTKVTKNKAQDIEPNWSPDGDLIVFQSNRTGDQEIWTIAPDGTGATNLTNDPKSDGRPVWSPNGNKIAFDSNRSGNYDIWVMKADGSSPENLTNDPAKDKRPDWQPVNTPMFEGIDVSHWQVSIDFDEVAASGMRFVFAKASEGKTYVDPTYPTYRTDAATAGLAFGAYHYARPDTSKDDAVDEADHFVDTALPASGDLRPVIDLEDAGGLSTTKLTDWLWDFLDEVETRTGVHALIYTSPSFWATHLGDTDEFADGGYDLLWIAHWFTPTPTVPGGDWGGNGWTFWQNDDCYSVDGISGCVDHDFYNGVYLKPALVP